MAQPPCLQLTFTVSGQRNMAAFATVHISNSHLNVFIDQLISLGLCCEGISPSKLLSLT